MDNFSKEELGKALVAITSLTGKCEKAGSKLTGGTAAHSMMSTRIAALRVASALISREIEGVWREK